MQTDRTDFNETWLCESPQGIGIWAAYSGIVDIIIDSINRKYPVSTQGNLNKIETDAVALYWIGTADGLNIELGCELYLKPQGYMVNAIGKKPSLKGQSPYASDLYLAILNDTDKAIRLLSDIDLSDEGYKIWKRLYSDPRACILVYDNSTAGKSYKILDTYEDFESFYKLNDSSYRKYQYVLMKHGSNSLLETNCFFNLRRMRELSGLVLED